MDPPWTSCKIADVWCACRITRTFMLKKPQRKEKQKGGACWASLVSSPQVNFKMKWLTTEFPCWPGYQLESHEGWISNFQTATSVALDPFFHLCGVSSLHLHRVCFRLGWLGVRAWLAWSQDSTDAWRHVKKWRMILARLKLSVWH